MSVMPSRVSIFACLALDIPCCGELNLIGEGVKTLLHIRRMGAA